MNNLIKIAFACLLFFPSLQGQETLQMMRLSNPIEFDGYVDEEEWSQIPTLPFIMQIPEFGGPPTEESIVRIAYDDDYLYLSANMLDKEPEKMLDKSKKRDAFTGNTEYFGMVIDSYNDN